MKKRTSTKSKHSDKAKAPSKVKKKTRDSKPPGVLNADQTARFQTTQEDIAELTVESIQPCPIIPDYRKPTESTLPIVVHSPAGCYCIDGWNLIEQAKAASQPAIRCYVFHIRQHSDMELAIRKFAIRTKPQGGTGSFAELVRNTKIVVKYLMDEMENPVVFSHGGARQGANFTNIKEDDLRQVLSERLGKERSTINAYVNFGRHLNDDVLETLVASNTGKAFFENVRVNKRTLINHLESDGLAQGDITAEVSGKIPEWLVEYQQTGKIKPDFDESDPPEEVEDQNNGATATYDDSLTSAREVETFQHRPPAAEREVPELPTEEGVKTEIRAIIEALSGLMDQTPFDCAHGIEIVGGQIEQLALIKQKIIDIQNRTENIQIKEAA
jgi:hypothetical protein